MNPIRRLDRYQREHRGAGFVFAVVQKFGEDQAANLAALIAYYAFLSVFPLLLALTTILGYVLTGAPGLRHVVVGSAVSQLPIIGRQTTLAPLSGNAFALVVGLLLAIWSGLAIAQTAQTAFNTVYAVARTEWPGFIPRLLRSVEIVVAGGLGLIATTLLQGLVSGTDSYGLHIGVAGQTLAAVIGMLANFGLFVYLFRRLTVAPVRAGDAWPGALVAAVAWFVLQKLGTSLVNRKIHGASGVYGTFAVVIGLLFWFFVLAQIVLLCAEINIVRSERLWPRGLSTLAGQASTRADVRAYNLYTRRETHARNLDVTTRYTPARPAEPADPVAPPAEGPGAPPEDEGTSAAAGPGGSGAPDEPEDDHASEPTRPLKLPKSDDAGP